MDLSLPLWGPYNKNILGVSHVADREKGLRFDVNLFPGFYRRSVVIPKDIIDSGTKMWASSKDLSHFVYRYELTWKDQVYMEADFSTNGKDSDIKCTFYNNTDNPESLTLNAVFSMKGPSFYRRDLSCCSIELGENAIWVDGIDYDEISVQNLYARDGMKLCEQRCDGFIGGSGFNLASLNKARNFVKYSVQTDKKPFVMRYRGEGEMTLLVNNKKTNLHLPKTDAVTDFLIETREDFISDITVFYRSGQMEIDGFLFGEGAEIHEDREWFKPEVWGDFHNLNLKFKDLEYKIKCDCETAVLRKLRADNLDNILTDKLHDHVSSELGVGKNEHIDLFIRPVFVDAHSSKTVDISISANKSEEFAYNHEICCAKGIKEGKKYELSQTMMRAVTLTNVVWPIYCKGEYIRHNTPGRLWDSLYTWDSGFIGLGLLQMDEARAKECLTTYLTEVGNIHSPFVMHGSTVPTQILLYSEIFSKTDDLDFIKDNYQKIRQEYRFYADSRKNGRAKKTGLFSLWDICYNSGGWDDYPTQSFVHENMLDNDVCPVINTAFTILCGKILKNIAVAIGEDYKEYDEDISFYSNALNTYSWDEESGYYGYVDHRGEPKILEICGVNGNMGMDGVYPYIAGITDENKDKKIIDHIVDGMFTECGVSVVDVNAPYYKKDGYWNGSVWLPHQWILWKAFLDNGEKNLNLKIAMTGLDTWQKEVQTTYNCYEHFMVQNGRGAGFHQFSGLSTPVLMWYNSLYEPYTITGGHFSLFSNIKKENKCFSFNAKLDGKKPSIIVCLEGEKKYEFKTSGVVEKINEGAYFISFEKATSEKIVISEL